MSNIPKIIHQIWYQGESNIPSHLKEYHQSWKDLNPDYIINIWDQTSIENLINSQSIEIIELYFSYQLMIQRIDFAKYIILLIYGGVYIDMDVKCLKSLNTIIKQHPNKNVILSICAYEPLHHFLLMAIGLKYNEHLINNGIIMCVPKHPIMKSIINKCLQNKNTLLKILGKNIYHIFYTTGPVMMTCAIRNINKNDVAILNHQFFEACNLNDLNFKCVIPNYAIGLHIYESSWVSNEEKRLTQIYFFLQKYYIVIIILIISILIYFNRKL